MSQEYSFSLLDRDSFGHLASESIFHTLSILGGSQWRVWVSERLVFLSVLTSRSSINSSGDLPLELLIKSCLPTKPFSLALLVSKWSGDRVHLPVRLPTVRNSDSVVFFTTSLLQLAFLYNSLFFTTRFSLQLAFLYNSLFFTNHSDIHFWINSMLVISQPKSLNKKWKYDPIFHWYS